LACSWESWYAAVRPTWPAPRMMIFNGVPVSLVRCPVPAGILLEKVDGG
jgi:hypothetical protein